LGAVALVAQTNLAAAVIFRQQFVLNALAWLVTRPPTSWPLRVRWTLGKYYHFGGLHVGAAVAGTIWYLVLVTSMIRDAVAGVGEASNAHMILGAMLFVDGSRGDRSFGSALLVAPAFWLVVLSAVLAVWPWLLLRRVPISYE
jgi:hypothetical protein